MMGKCLERTHDSIIDIDEIESSKVIFFIQRNEREVKEKVEMTVTQE